MHKEELLALIGDGMYGYDIPDDDGTMETLAECVRNGWVGSEQGRLDDFFFLTESGKEEASLSP